MEICARVKRVVLGWLGNPPIAVGNNRLLLTLWTQHGNAALPYCNEAVADLIRRLVQEFKKPPKIKILMKATDFCPSDKAKIRSVADLCKAVNDSD